jgi:uncharacterized protein
MIAPTPALANLEDTRTTTSRGPTNPSSSLSVQPLVTGQEFEVLDFLANRPLHTFVMAGHIRDNGLESSFNRGRFYGCRNANGKLTGVALIGHATLLETDNDEALSAFAELARSTSCAHMIMGEADMVARFWKNYAGAEPSPQRISHTVLYELRWPVQARDPIDDLRPAAIDDLEQIMKVQGEMACAESGINPLHVDPEGFRIRCARRVEKNRVWIYMKESQLIFKADVISDTPQVIYLEGTYVDPQHRGQSLGTRCLSQLARNLLKRTDSICVLVNEQSRQARSFFEQVGFKLCSQYESIFLTPQLTHATEVQGAREGGMRTP